LRLKKWIKKIYIPYCKRGRTVEGESGGMKFVGGERQREWISSNKDSESATNDRRATAMEEEQKRHTQKEGNFCSYRYFIFFIIYLFLQNNIWHFYFLFLLFFTFLRKKNMYRQYKIILHHQSITIIFSVSLSYLSPLSYNYKSFL
jgi:hypothetical protein